MDSRMSTKNLNRRQFLQRSAVAAGAVIAAPTIIPSTALGADGATAASERITVGVIGCGGRGQHVMRAFMANSDAHVVAVCDCFKEKRDQAKGVVDQTYGNSDCKTYVDMLELIDRKDIDALLIATGDNWHSGVSLIAARAGKDMYCEKPMSVALTESRAVSDTMTRLGRIFQCGTQRRNIGNFRFAVELARSGKLGELKELHAEEAGGLQTLYDTVLPTEDEPARDVFDWNRWLGPAPWRPYNHEYPTRGFWSAHVDFSGGSITEWGSHTVDICQWANNSDDTGPTEFYKEGDRYIGQYENGAKIVIRTGLRFGSCPVRFEGTEGWVETGDSGQIETYPKSLLGNRAFEGGYPPDNHVRQFLDCVKSRVEPVSHAEVAHRSISVCHIANICKRLGRPVKWDPVNEVCPDDAEATRMLARAYREPWYL